VRNFAPDCVKFKCTKFQYIGELGRYLVNAPPCEDDKNVRLTFAMGNGMRPDVWEAFKKRYNVGEILEFYGATEGNVSLFNLTGKVGAIGYVPSVLQMVKSIK
jgi:fatty-acyl-CoA synthase